ncbi:uncharacterized protein [Argopecten irradians]|uniref:uncharacterized protein n=1 Tax=Argopecten irradians TaxID=31199 RepID=UPI00371394AC
MACFEDLQRKTVTSPSENFIVPPSEKLTQPPSEKPTKTSSEKTQKLTKLPSVRSTLPPNRKTTVQSSAKPTVSTSDKPTLSPQWPPVTLQSQWPTLAPIMENPEGATMNTATDANHWLDLFRARQSQTGLVEPSPTQDSFSSLFNPSGTLPPVNSNMFSSLLPSPTRSFFDQLISVSPTNQPSFITTMVENQSTSTAARKRSEPTLPSPTNAYPPSTLGEQHKAAQEMDTSDVTKKMPGIPVTMSSMTVRTTLEPNKMYPTSVFTASPGVNTLFQAASRPEPSRRIGGNRNVPTDPAPTSTYNKEGMYMPVNASGTNTFVSMAPSFSTTVDHAQLEEQKKAMEELEKRQKQAANNLKVQQEMLKQIKEMLSALTTFFERGIVNKIMSAARTTVSSPQPTAPTRIPTFLSEEPFLNRHTRRHADVQFVTDRIEAGTTTTAVTMQPTQPTSTTTEDPTTTTTTTPTTTTRTTTTPTTTTITTTTTTPAPTTTTTTSTTMSTTPIPTTTLPSTTLPPQDFAVDAVVQGPGSMFSQIQGNADPNTPSLNELAMSAAMRQINKQVSRVEVNEGTNAQQNVPQTLSFSPLKNNEVTSQNPEQEQSTSSLKEQHRILSSLT